MKPSKGRVCGSAKTKKKKKRKEGLIMKKFILLLAVLTVTSPAWAAIDIACVPSPGQDGQVLVDITYTSTELNHPRAFAFNITVSNGASIVGVPPESVDPNFNIHPGSFGLDEFDNPTGSVVCDPMYPDTLPGGPEGITTEQASLYIGEANAPGQSGTLFTVIVNVPNPIVNDNGTPGDTSDDYIEDPTLTIAPNVTRAGSNGVVMEDPDEGVVVNYSAPCTLTSVCWCMGDGTSAELPAGPYGKNARVDIFDLQTMALILLPTSPTFTMPTPAGLECLDIVHTGTLLHNPEGTAIDGADGTLDIYDLQNMALYLLPTSPVFDQPCLQLGYTGVAEE